MKIPFLLILNSKYIINKNNEISELMYIWSPLEKLSDLYYNVNFFKDDMT